ncbi:hypothetical protein, partial [Klebsiella pneumoniae]|uniref:hypothetical protein n=1 Tax=Klebsiella pneumoniae TaxID=573 RepID=UPI00195422EA
FLGDAEPALVVCDPARRDGITEVAKKTGVPAVETLGKSQDGSLFDKAAGATEAFTDVARGPGDLAAILYT